MSSREEDIEDEIELAAKAEFHAAGLIRLLVQAIERGDAELGIALSAWDNTMAAVEWALPMHVAGRLEGPAVVTVEDVERMRRMRALGAAALAGGAADAELLALAPLCVETLLGPDWTRYALRAEEDARELLRLSPLRRHIDERRPTQEDLDDELHLALISEIMAAGYITVLAAAVERGDAPLGVDPTAWENVMVAVEWSMGERAAGRIHGPTSVSTDDIERMRMMRDLGAAALAGEAVAAELLTLAPRCIESLFGPNNEHAVKGGVEAVKGLSQVPPPSSRQ